MNAAIILCLLAAFGLLAVCPKAEKEAPCERYAKEKLNLESER